MVEVVGTTLGELVQVHQQTTLVLHPPTPVPPNGCLAPNLLTRAKRFTRSQLSLRRSLPFLLPARLRDYRLRVREETGVTEGRAVRFLTVDLVDDTGRVVLLDHEEVKLLRTLVARLWTHPQFIVFDLGPRGAHPIKHLPPTPDVYQAWFESVPQRLEGRLGPGARLTVVEQRLVYQPAPANDVLNDTIEAELVEVEELVWESLRDYFQCYTHLGVPLDPDYHPEPQQVLAYYSESSSVPFREALSPLPVDSAPGAVPNSATFVQEYFRWHYFMDVHLDIDRVPRTVTGRSVAELTPSWPPNHLLLSADPLWVVALLTQVSLPVIYHHGLYLTTDTEEHRRTLAILRGPIDDWVATRHQQGAMIVDDPTDDSTAEGSIAQVPVQVIETVPGERLGRAGVTLLAVRSLMPSIVYRTLRRIRVTRVPE